ncbi:zinc finger and SCAN domain-containing protein 9-like isoform X3 [Poeciliopsis prolifica]|uniref:zinc finger and SCAN domain-containing protein 9-like isoform X3 n=1 Tax=Poeciliopsis prolifica TaxID=188132 RepID=UPI0024140E1C|nr:zinc finger and SCAN domain-containing protein 9-like isoform X3 [Poeciliopsis prolifica]
MKASSLRLLLSPLRLLTAAMWQVIQQQSVKHYGMLEEFVTLVTEAIPQLLTERQRGVLLLALRAKVTLSHPADDQTHLERIRCISKASQDEQLTECCSALLSLTQTPADSQCLLQALLSDLLTRIEQLFPVPDFRQAACWLHDAPCVLEDFLQETDRKHLMELLTNQSCRLGRATTAVSGETEEMLLSAWSHPLLTSPAHPDQSGQSEGGPPQLNVKVELMTQDMIGQSGSEEEREVSNLSPEGGGVTPVVEGGVRMKDSPGQSEGSQLTAISHNSQRVAHRCPACRKCFIYRSQVIRHLRSNRTCGSSGKSESGALQGRSEGEPRPLRAHACFQCSSTFTTRTELVTHCRTHLTRPVYQCNQCDSAFQLQSSLTNHKQPTVCTTSPAPSAHRPSARRRGCCATCRLTQPRELSASTGVCSVTRASQESLSCASTSAATPPAPTSAISATSRIAR